MSFIKKNWLWLALGAAAVFYFKKKNDEKKGNELAAAAAAANEVATSDYVEMEGLGIDQTWGARNWGWRPQLPSSVMRPGRRR